MNPINLVYKPVNDSHIPLLFQWLNAGHIKGIYDHGYHSDAHVREKFLSPEIGVERYIVFYQKIPFGYIHKYLIHDKHIYSPYKHAEGSTIGIDLFIGEKNYLGRGYGFEMLRQFVAALNFDIQRIIVDPESSNMGSIAFFQKYGFKKRAEFIIKNNKHDILIVNLRKAVRGIILNAKKEVLLIQVKADPRKYQQKKLTQFWLTPGGKVEQFESYEQALIREIREEVNFTSIEIGHVVHQDEWIDVWHEYPLRLFNRYYLVRSKELDFNNQNLMEDEKEIVLGYKWWNIQELSNTREIIYPNCLIDLIKAL